MASQTIGEAAAIPPAALALAANDDFAEVMFAGVMEDRFLFRRVGRVAVSAPALGQTQRGENSPPPAFRQPVQGRVSTYTACQTLPVRAASRAAARTSFRCRCCARYRAGSHRGCARLSPALAVAPGAHLLIDAVGGAAQGQLAQRNQIALAEKVFDSALGRPPM